MVAPVAAAGLASVIAPAAITGGAGLLGGLFAQAAERKRQEREMAAKAEEKGFEAQMEATQALTQGQQKAFNDLVQNFSMALR